MFESFTKNFKPDQTEINNNRSSSLIEERSVLALFNECGGTSISNGLYRIHTPETSLLWANLISRHYKQYQGRIIPFGFDWMGRQFALDTSRDKYLVMFDPSTHEDMELNQDLITFHNHELLYEKESYLAFKLFRAVLGFIKANNISYTECAGYRIPLFLNGTDTVDNYELSDMEVYWEFQCQLFDQTKDLPPGTKVNVNYRPYRPTD